MRILLDTHTLIWYADSPERLPKTVRDEITDGHNEVFISVASAWEMTYQSKHRSSIIGESAISACRGSARRQSFRTTPNWFGGLASPAGLAASPPRSVRPAVDRPSDQWSTQICLCRYGFGYLRSRPNLEFVATARKGAQGNGLPKSIPSHAHLANFGY